MTKESCGCKHNGLVWVEMCPPHRTQTDADSLRWAQERLAGVVITRTTYHGQAKPTQPLESTDWLDISMGQTV